MTPTDILVREHRVIEQVLNCLEQVEAEEIGKGTHEKYHALADRLADRFGVPRADAHRPTP